jgi:hypothetical protein
MWQKHKAPMCQSSAVTQLNEAALSQAHTLGTAGFFEAASRAASSASASLRASCFFARASSRSSSFALRLACAFDFLPSPARSVLFLPTTREPAVVVDRPNGETKLQVLGQNHGANHHHHVECMQTATLVSVFPRPESMYAHDMLTRAEISSMAAGGVRFLLHRQMPLALPCY